MSLPYNRKQARLPPEVNRILYIRSLPYKITADEMYDIFGKYGAIRQIRIGNTPETKGTAFVVYEDIFDAKNACDHLSGFNVCNRYLVVLYYQPNKAFKKVDINKKEADIENLKQKYNVWKPTKKDSFIVYKKIYCHIIYMEKSNNKILYQKKENNLHQKYLQNMFLCVCVCVFILLFNEVNIM